MNTEVPTFDLKDLKKEPIQPETLEEWLALNCDETNPVIE